LESEINLQIALRLDDLLHLIGIKTIMTRKIDQSIHTEGKSIAAKKVSDLKQRVKIVNGSENSTLVSIHQNYFADSRYSGAQVFYAPTVGSEKLANQLQKTLQNTLNPNNTRHSKSADGIYLMQHISCTGILLECGFLSNPEEERNLNNPEYQKKLCSVLASLLSCYLQNPNS
jgi:N-acetylmuramoyl-L-alanine amidase